MYILFITISISKQYKKKRGAYQMDWDDTQLWYCATLNPKRYQYLWGYDISHLKLNYVTRTFLGICLETISLWGCMCHCKIAYARIGLRKFEGYVYKLVLYERIQSPNSTCLLEKQLVAITINLCLLFSEKVAGRSILFLSNISQASQCSWVIYDLWSLLWCILPT